MPSIFTRIIDGELPGHFVWRDEHAVAFLSINPLSPGHTLVVPRADVDHWLDLEPELARHLMDVARSVGRAIHDVFRPTKVGLMIAGLEVRHVHLHLSCIDRLHDLDFGSAATSVPAEELAANARRIRDRLRELGHAEAAE